jgi:hypothetical protein
MTPSFRRSDIDAVLLKWGTRKAYFFKGGEYVHRLSRPTKSAAYRGACRWRRRFVPHRLRHAHG